MDEIQWLLSSESIIYYQAEYFSHFVDSENYSASEKKNPTSHFAMAKISLVSKLMLIMPIDNLL